MRAAHGARRLRLSGQASPAAETRRPVMIIGLTGGMGCGKSTAAGFFEELGWGRVDTDEVVRAMLREDADVIAGVRAAFGDGVIAADGAVDRHKLAGVVFPDRGALRRLEAILHPRVREVWKDRVAGSHGQPWLVEIPLLFEKGLEKEFDFTVCVACDPAVQLQRVAARGFPPHEAAQRIARQLPLAQKIERADFVLTNNGSLLFLRNQVTRLAHLIMRSTR
jgi:dephospho-CoA kinase